MPLEPIGDIAQATLSANQPTQPITWQTATDWDNAVSESSVIHEPIGDVTADDVIRLGLSPSFDTFEFYYHANDSSAPVEDVSGNGRDASEFNTPDYDQTGVFGTTSVGFNANDSERLRSPDYSINGTLSVAGWFFITGGAGSNTDFCGLFATDTLNNEGDYFQLVYETSSGGVKVQYDEGPNNQTTAVTPAVDDGSWHHIAATAAANDRIRIFVDGVEEVNESTGIAFSGDTRQMVLMAERGEVVFTDGRAAQLVTTNDELSAATIDELASTSGSLTTDTKSFPSPVTPDLESLSYSLNGESITLDVIGSPGTADEEVVTQSLAGGSSYTLSWSSGHTDFRVRVEPSTSDPTATPTFGRVDLTP